MRASLATGSRTSREELKMIRSRRNHFIKLTTGILVSWFLFAVDCSWLGLFDNPQRPPLLIGLAAVVPVLLFLAWYLRSRELRQFLLDVDLRLLTLVQTGRVAGILFVLLHARGLLPGIFALPAGWGDIAVGATAPFVAWTITAVDDFRKEVFIWWNTLGMADLVLAVTLGILSSGAFPAFETGASTTELMGRLPLSLVPTFFVPVYFIVHIISLSRVLSLHPATTQSA
jgi:hypothetical protein